MKVLIRKLRERPEENMQYRMESGSFKKKVDKIYCAPGNAGIEEYAECVNIFCKKARTKKRDDLTVIGMDDPLVGGVVDFEAEGPAVYGKKFWKVPKHFPKI